MNVRPWDSSIAQSDIVMATGERPLFVAGDRIRVFSRKPFWHYRVPLYLRGKTGWIESVVEPAAINNEEEGFGRNAGIRLHYYRAAFAMTDIWAGYGGVAHDTLRIEVFETWLERMIS